MREPVRRREEDDDRAPARTTPAQQPPALELASAVGNQAFARLARSGWEGGPEPDLEGYNAEPDYGGKAVEPALDAADPKGRTRAENLGGEAEAAEHTPLPVDSPEATHVPEGAKVTDVGGGPTDGAAPPGYEGGPEPDLEGYNAEPDYGGKAVEPALDAADPKGRTRAENLGGEAEAAEHTPLPVDSPEATHVPEGAKVTDVDGGGPDAG